MQNPKSSLLWLVFDDQGMDAHVRHVKAGPPAGVGFLDAARQRRFATDGDPVCGREHVSHEQARRKDQLILRSKRIALRIHFIEQDARQQAAPAKALPGFGDGFLYQGLFSYIYAPDRDLYSVI